MAPWSSSTRRFFIGTVCLFLADLIWGSIRYYTEHVKFDKENPFFSSYIYASSLSVYLIGFLFVDSWRSRCFCAAAFNEQWKPLSEDDEKPESESENSAETESDRNINTGVDDASNTEFRYIHGPPAAHQMSDPLFVRRDSLTDSETSSLSGNEALQVKAAYCTKVKFSRVKEVRILPDQEAEDAHYARRSYESSKLVVQRILNMQQQMSLKEVAVVSLALSVPFMGYIYLANLGASHTTHWSSHAFLSLSGFWVLLLSTLLPSNLMDTFTLSKFFAVCLSIAGCIMVSVSEEDKPTETKNMLSAWVIPFAIAALLISIFVVVLKRRARTLNRVNLFMFLGFLGTWCLLLYWPMVFVFKAVKLEPLDIDSLSIWEWLVVKCIFGGIVAWALWLWGCFLLSPLAGVASLVLLCPFSIGWSTIIHNGTVSWELLVAGSVFILGSYVLILVLQWKYNSDPVGYTLGTCCAKCLACCEVLSMGVYVDEEQGKDRSDCADSEESVRLLDD
ncbi:solute carrier family 35 member F5-like [Oscarella lobularis]|uniref:solute carrier family 35 member F5-like n=1 Tax=Oscarella lobularis TaxID=121494 RepID=UPI0033142AE8